MLEEPLDTSGGGAAAPCDDAHEWAAAGGGFGLSRNTEPLGIRAVRVAAAQVHRATMRVGGRPLAVVLKVRHPGVVTRLTQDFRLLKPLAAAAPRLPSLKALSLRESLAQFSATMTAQARQFWHHVM